ncbi:MAG: ATPase [Actinomycetia bacterium]|nr:ATPase [Actinomycetes bacterium]
MLGRYARKVRQASKGWPSARLHIVTGKGGTGKTTVSAALALALAAGGKRTLLIEVEGRQGFAQLFDVSPLPYSDRKVAVAPRGGEVRALAVDAEQALLEYLDMFYKLGRAGKALKKLGAIDFATTIAPGMRDVLLTGKVKEAVTRVENGRRVYDAVVLDAPPTGRVGRFLNVTAQVASLARVGPVKSQSDGVMAVLRSPMTAVHLVTLLEEMPVQEVSDTIAELIDSGLPVGSVIVNAVRTPALAAKVTGPELRRGLAAAGLATDKETIRGLLDESSAYGLRVQLEDRLRAELTELGRPMLELPFLPEGVDLGGLYKLADTFCAAGVHAP